ncbi:hypothetical protein [Fibrobacter sp.]|uniref:hypothetical protein n=1 Tax=Fibrobacter sp. TaxID=35828 RepID=UPI0026018877|nr:hypothetical protein [Fibrobacter sp.]MDD5942137.1 hypothetical protein [Fibrobacter sp.]
MKTDVALPLLQDKNVHIKWGKSASDVTQDALDIVSQYIGTHFVSFNIETHEKEFIDTLRNAIEKGEIIRTQITPDNLKQVFDKWVETVGKEIVNAEPENFAEFFYADVMSDGKVSTHEHLSAELLHKGNKPIFLLNGKTYEIASIDGYSQFWAIYDRPPKEEFRSYLLERRDSLIPVDERTFKGAYYTPLNVVDKAYDLLEKTLGSNWQKDYYVWDMCCGVGNLEAKHSNHRHLFMSTLDQEDVNIMKAAKICVSAERFQYDYLNDDITDNGTIDYSLTNKIPQTLQNVIRDANEGKKKLLVLINPPYAEVGSAFNASSKDNTAKTGVNKTRFGQYGMKEYGKASNELFTQFVARIAKEIPNATLAMFSTLKYVNSQTMEVFRKQWCAQYLGGFVVHSKSFEGLKGNFPIGFLIWKTFNVIASKAKQSKCMFPSEISCEVLDKSTNPIGEKKFYNAPNERYLATWIGRPEPNTTEIIPLKNAISPATRTTDLRCKFWSDDAIGYMRVNSNDMQQANDTSLFSSGYSGGHGYYVNEDNLKHLAVVYSVRHLIDHTWINHNDQFLQPNCELPQEFIDDCLIYMLFHGKNLTASANDLEWNGKKWSIVNHFIPFTEEDVGASARFESDFMVQYMQSKAFSAEAHAVLDEGRKIWATYFKQTFNHKIREELKLNRADVGWYQIRQALKAQNESGNSVPVSFTAFESAYKALSEKLRPQVYQYGFLK